MGVARRRVVEAPPVARPDAPAFLGDAGREVWARIVGSLADDFELDERDLITLTDAARIADTIAELDSSIRERGAVLDTGKVNPAVVELRQQQVALMRLLASVKVDDSRRAMTPTQRRASEAAAVRWNLERQKYGSGRSPMPRTSTPAPPRAPGDPAVSRFPVVTKEQSNGR